MVSGAEVWQPPREAGELPAAALSHSGPDYQNEEGRAASWHVQLGSRPFFFSSGENFNPITSGFSGLRFYRVGIRLLLGS